MIGHAARSHGAGRGTDDLVATLARNWVGWYTAWVGAEAAERRRAEIASDLWEQQTDARSRQLPALEVAVSIGWRVFAGVPADLLWVRTQRLAARGRPAERKAHLVTTFKKLAARWWWAAAAAVLAAYAIGAGIQNIVDPYPGTPMPQAAIQSFLLAALLLGGVLLRARAPRTAAALTVAAATPCTTLVWSPVLMALGIAILAGALVELVRTTPGSPLQRGLSVLGALLVGFGLLVPGSGVAGISGWVLAGLSILVGILLLLVTGRTRAQAATPVPA